ncbi:hypothetical protein LTR16_000493 [Cryomyces antarcticus]|uniref:NAD(P)-binding protein n=1 Tax=Cryomyces antarcticus TaxID=329879 RepID=A0ABR0KUM8_9PEZI|nr:hypothetical protein LTR16_000493 [Cryomyces antarcticus]
MVFYSFIYGNKYTSSSLPNLSGKVAIVTGGNTGIGYETARLLAKNGAKVYLAARSEEKANTAIEKIRSGDIKGSVEYLPIDLMDLSSVTKAAQAFANKEKRLDILMNNAGIMANPYELTKDGVESQFQTNHLSHFLLTNLLLPSLRAAPHARVVSTSSLAYTSDPSSTFASLEDINQSYGSSWKRYGQSKLANILFARKLTALEPDMFVNSAHPGFVSTELGRGIVSSYGAVVGTIQAAITFVGLSVGAFLTPEQGALTQLYLATSKEVEEKGIRGKYYVPIAQEGNGNAKNLEERAETLWRTSVKILEEKGIALSLCSIEVRRIPERWKGSMKYIVSNFLAI